jgi:hypothetical protein
MVDSAMISMNVQLWRWPYSTPLSVVKGREAVPKHLLELLLKLIPPQISHGLLSGVFLKFFTLKIVNLHCFIH